MVTTTPLELHQEIDSVETLIRAIVIEGVERILTAPLQAQTERARAYLQELGLTRAQADRLDSFMFNYIVEATAVAGLLGYGLALTHPELGSHEAWLNAAMQRVGLDVYTHPAELAFEPQVQAAE